jgi:ribokinase
MNELKEELIEKLREVKPKEIKIVVMPHLCIDNFIQYGENFESFAQKLEYIVNQGGGNLFIKQNLKRGGKAANCASALSSLGMKTYLISKTNGFGYELLKFFFKGKNVDISHVSKDGELAFTTSIELKDVNVMLSDSGSLSKFGPEFLSDKDEKLIREADVVCISDWGLNERGTELAKHVFSIVKEGKKGKTYFDPGDPSPKGDTEEKEITRLETEVLEIELVDYLNINENEAKRYARVEELSMAIGHLRSFTRVDLHTKDYARCFHKNNESEKIPTFDVQSKRLTGAGDAWDAGNIFGDIIGLSDDLRLMIANAVAAYYISNSEGIHPTKEDLIEFLGEVSFKRGKFI